MRKHSTLMWGVIIVVVVFAFVIWGTPGGRRGGRVGIYGRINGKPVTEQDKVQAVNEVKLRYFLRNGRWPGVEAERTGFDMQEQVFSLLMLVQKLEERKMFAGDEAKANMAANILRGLQSTEIQTLADFENKILKPQGITLADLDRFMEHHIALRQLMAVEGFSGQLIAPQQVQALWERENQEISAQVVFFSASNYLNSVQVTPAALGSFFTNQMARYRIPDRIQVSYVAYPISNYLAQADEQLASLTNLDLQIESIYSKRGTNFYSDVTPEKAREQIREEIRHQAAVLAARKDAVAFADELWQQEPMKASDLEVIGSQKGLTVQVTKPFDRNSTPEGLDVNSTFTQAAFQLRDDEPFGGPIEGNDHLYVITIKQRLASTNARFEDVKDKVTSDYIQQQATLKAREAGRAFAGVATNTLAMSKPFTEACTQMSVRPQLLPPFSRNTRSLPEVEEHTSLSVFKQVAFSTPVGKTSPFSFTSDGGYVIYVASRLPVDEARMKAELPEFTQAVRQTLEGDMFNTWFSQEAEVGLRETPLSQAPPPQVSTPGT